MKIWTILEYCTPLVPLITMYLVHRLSYDIVIDSDHDSGHSFFTGTERETATGWSYYKRQKYLFGVHNRILEQSLALLVSIVLVATVVSNWIIYLACIVPLLFIFLKKRITMRIFLGYLRKNFDKEDPTFIKRDVDITRIALDLIESKETD